MNKKNLHPKQTIVILVSTDENKVSIIVGITDDLTLVFMMQQIL